MGIGINVGSMKTDYSFLFQSMSGGGMSNLNFLSDYASIKNGSYGKLMKAYYTKDANKGVSSAEKNNKKDTSTAKDSAKTLSSIEEAADKLKDSADALSKTGSKSVFNKVDVERTDENGVTTTTKEYDVNAIYKSVNEFVNNYNDVIKKAGESATTSVQNRAKFMTTATEANKRMLEKVGVTINKDKTLSLDEKTFKEADMNTVKSLFNGSMSYANRISSQASMVESAAKNEASKANTYDWKGNYNNSYNTGSIYDYGF